MWLSSCSCQQIKVLNELLLYAAKCDNKLAPYLLTEQLWFLDHIQELFDGKLLAHTDSILGFLINQYVCQIEIHYQCKLRQILFSSFTDFGHIVNMSSSVRSVKFHTYPHYTSSTTYLPTPALTTRHDHSLTSKNREHHMHTYTLHAFR